MLKKYVVIVMIFSLILGSFTSAFAEGPIKKIEPQLLESEDLRFDLREFEDAQILTKAEDETSRFDSFTFNLLEENEMIYTFERDGKSYKVHEFFNADGEVESYTYIKNDLGRYELEISTLTYVENNNMLYKNQETGETVNLTEEIQSNDVNNIAPLQNDPGGGSSWNYKGMTLGSNIPHTVTLIVLSGIVSALAILPVVGAVVTTATTLYAFFVDKVYWKKFTFSHTTRVGWKYNIAYYTDSARTITRGVTSTSCMGMPRMGECFSTSWD